MNPVRFLIWILGLAFTLGMADSFTHLTYEMAKAAIHSHQHSQISYTNYNKFLWRKK